MAQREIPLKYRAICSDCKQPFDIRTGGLHHGRRICTDCNNEMKYRTVAPEPYKRHREINW